MPYTMTHWYQFQIQQDLSHLVYLLQERKHHESHTAVDLIDHSHVMTAEGLNHIESEYVTGFAKKGLIHAIINI